MRYQSTRSGLYKDRLNKKISGVCAGIARANNLPIWSVRLTSFVLFLFFPVAILMAYFIGMLVLPERYY
jgi:phage shock protein PspC (stress-responsive transcriptional regulator)